jgi:hypothetical protein
VPPHLQSELSESQAMPASALRSPLGPLVAFLDDPHVVEVMLNADGVVWVEKVGEGVLRAPVAMPAADAERTLAVDDRLAATIAGVRPRVQLLLQLRTPGRIGRARDFFAYLARTERDPSALADDFYVRVGAVLAGRLRSHKILLSLLPPPRASSASWTL